VGARLAKYARLMLQNVEKGMSVRESDELNRMEAIRH